MDTHQATGPCIGCAVAGRRITPPGGIIHQDAYWVVNHYVGSPRIPLLGFLIVQPNRHCEHIGSLTAEEAVALGGVLQLTCRALSVVLNPERVYVCSFGEEQHHIHFWIVPRAANMPSHGPDLLRTITNSDKWSCTPEQAAELAEQVRGAFSQLPS